MNVIKQERGWAQATTELAERELTAFPAALARFPCGHTAKPLSKGVNGAGFLQRVRMGLSPDSQFYF
jgi:hypothetical protein